MKKNILIFLVLILMIFSLFSCASYQEQTSGLGIELENEKEEKIKTLDKVTFGYYPDMDLNPITCNVKENQAILSLIYSPLIIVDKTYKPQNVLAQDIKTQDKKLTITLKDDLKFSDGSNLDSSDVVKTLNSARYNPLSPYYNNLQNFSGIYSLDKKTIIIQMRQNDVDASAFLNVPIIKNGNELVGCGPYKFVNGDRQKILKSNDKFFKTPALDTIYLKAFKDENSENNMFSIGIVDLLIADTSDSSSVALNRDFQTKTLTSDYMIFLGLNCQKPLLSNKKIRCVLSDCINRVDVAKAVLSSKEGACKYPVSPNFYKLEKIKANETLSMKEITQKFKNIGFTVNNSGKIVPAKEALSFNIMVNKDNKIRLEIAKQIKSQLEAYGITLNIEPVSQDEFNLRLKSRNYDIYIGETKLGIGQNASFLYRMGSEQNYLNFGDEKLDALYDNYRLGTSSLEKFLKYFYEQSPIIPLIYKNTAIYVSNGINNIENQSPFNILGDITKWSIEDNKK